MKPLLAFFLLFVIVSSSNAQVSLHLYGGKDHDVYLGCINCGKYDANSIWNSYGTYGSKFSSNSIWNVYGSFGGKYSSTSPFNSYASEPPVLVDKEGNFYGYFTSNAYHDKRAESKLSLIIYKYWEEIKDDVATSYDNIFK